MFERSYCTTHQSTISELLNVCASNPETQANILSLIGGKIVPIAVFETAVLTMALFNHIINLFKANNSVTAIRNVLNKGWKQYVQSNMDMVIYIILVIN